MDEIIIHQMKLNSIPFDMIKKGIKTIELRLNDLKRQKIKINDYILFTHIETKAILKCRVVNLYLYNSFEQLYQSLDLLKCGYTNENIKQASHKDMEQYYLGQDEKKYGVVGIELIVI